MGMKQSRAVVVAGARCVGLLSFSEAKVITITKRKAFNVSYRNPS